MAPRPPPAPGPRPAPVLRPFFLAYSRLPSPLAEPLSANPQEGSLAGTSYASTSFASSLGSDESGTTPMAQATILSGKEGMRDDEEEVETLLHGSNTLGDEEGELLSGSNLMGDDLESMLGGNINSNNINEDEIGESSTAVVDRSNDPRFQSTEAYLGLPINQVVEGPEYVDHAWHDLMNEEAPGFEAFIDNALSYPAKVLDKAAAEAFPWKHCDDVSKLDKIKFFGFSREIPTWLNFYCQETRFYVQYIGETQALHTALKTRLNQLQHSNRALQEEREILNHRLARVHGINTIVGAQRYLILARVNEIIMTESNQKEEVRQLLLQLWHSRNNYNRVVGTALQLDSEHDAPEVSRAEEKHKAEEKAKLKEERELMNSMKLQSQKDVEAKALRLHNEAKARAEQKAKDKRKGKAVNTSPTPGPTSPIPFVGRSRAHFGGLSTFSGPSPFAGRPTTPLAGPSTRTGLSSSRPVGRSAAPVVGPSSSAGVYACPPLPSYYFLTAGPSSSRLSGPSVTPSGPSFSAGSSTTGAYAYPPSSSSYPPTTANADEVASFLSNLAYPQPQTLAEAARLLNSSPAAHSAATTSNPDPTRAPSPPPQPAAPAWFAIFEAQQLVSLAGSTPRARFDQLMVYNAGLYSRAEQGDSEAARKYKTLNEAMATAMAQGNKEDTEWLREKVAREDEERERMRVWNKMTFEEKRDMGFY